MGSKKPAIFALFLIALSAIRYLGDVDFVTTRILSLNPGWMKDTVLFFIFPPGWLTTSLFIIAITLAVYAIMVAYRKSKSNDQENIGYKPIKAGESPSPNVLTASVVTSNATLDNIYLETKPFKVEWKKVSILTLWQAAWLWIGQEPVTQVIPLSDAYPTFRRLKTDAISGKLHVHKIGPSGEIDANTEVTRGELKIYAGIKNESVDFLAD